MASAERRAITNHSYRDGELHRAIGLKENGEAVVSQVRYANGSVWINPTQHFTDVPVDVWNYEVGAHQVCEKWLKDRKGSVLGYNEVRQYRNILIAVAETLRLMEAIDEIVEEFLI